MRIGNARPVLIYLMMIYAAFEWHWERTAGLALVIGVLRDAVSAHPFGIEMTVLVLTSFVLDFVIHKIERHSWMMRLAVAGVFVLTVLLAQILLSVFLGSAKTITWQTGAVCFDSAVYTTLCVPPFFYFTSKWFSRRPIARQYELFD
jgi:rod shape-determining protein MreD